MSREVNPGSGDPFDACEGLCDSDFHREDPLIPDLLPELESILDQQEWFPVRDPFEGPQFLGFG